MSTANKLQDEWLLSYAAGALDPGRSLMVASHIAYHDDLQNAVADAESIGGSLLETIQQSDVNDSILDALMNRLDDTEMPEITPVAAASGKYPQPLMDYMNCDMEAIKWRFMGPGMRYSRLWHGPNDERLWLLRARGGVQMPEHGHNGDEWTLVLKGSFSTELGHYRMGDIDVASEDIVHQPKIDEGEDCICLVMTEGPIRLQGAFSRMLQPLIGI
jgi:putative transcriptional regulator